MSKESEVSELSQLKSVLRSLVVSSPTAVDARTLLREYRAMLGEPLPAARHGYRDPLRFLRERCADCFLFQGPETNPTLTLIVTDALRHIDQYVQRQRNSNTKLGKSKRRSVPESAIRPPQNHTIANAHRETQARPEPPTKHDARRESGAPTPAPAPIPAPTPTPDPTPTPAPTPAGASEAAEAQYSPSLLQRFLQKRSSAYQSQQLAAAAAAPGEHEPGRDDDDSGRHTTSSRSGRSGGSGRSGQERSASCAELRARVLRLVRDHPAGVRCSDLFALYEERYRRELDFASFRYPSIGAFVTTLGAEVTLRRDPAGGEWTLLPAPAGGTPERGTPERGTAAEGTPARGTPPLRRPARALSHAASAAADPESALPGIDYAADIFPADCVHFLESIPAAGVADIRAGALLDVQVGELYSPSHLWLQRLGPRHHLAMEDVMDAMTRYYGAGEGRERRLAAGAVRVGQYCSCAFEGDWHRALVVQLLDCDTVKVRHVDYGTVDTVRAAALKPLRREWAALPAQALRARLAGLRPPAAGRRWARPAAAHCLRLVAERRLVAHVAAVDYEEEILEVFLVDTSGEEDVCVTREMLRAGHADPRPDLALPTSECYLYPRFSALESGATPNYAEIHALLRDGIALDFVDDYRRHVPACLPPPAPSTSAASAASTTSNTSPPAPTTPTTPTPPASSSPPDTPPPPRSPTPSLPDPLPARPSAPPQRLVNRVPLRWAPAAEPRAAPPLPRPPPPAYRFPPAAAYVAGPPCYGPARYPFYPPFPPLPPGPYSPFDRFLPPRCFPGYPRPLGSPFGPAPRCGPRPRRPRPPGGPGGPGWRAARDAVGVAVRDLPSAEQDGRARGAELHDGGAAARGGGGGGSLSLLRSIASAARSDPEWPGAGCPRSACGLRH